MVSKLLIYLRFSHPGQVDKIGAVIDNQADEDIINILHTLLRRES